MTPLAVATGLVAAVLVGISVRLADL
jgi:hypothetical protein